MRSAWVIGKDGFIGAKLVAALEAFGVRTIATGRAEVDVLNLPSSLPVADVTFYCAGITKFIECDRRGSEAWRVNVDAPVDIARSVAPRIFVYLSSEAVEHALHSGYGMQKAFAELSMLTLPNASVVRIGDQKKHSAVLQRTLDVLVDIVLSGEPRKGLRLNA